jgi:hypothetical protein
MLRNNYNDEKILFPRTIANINYLDVILTIFFYEEFATFKYGLEASSFGNIIPKIMHENIAEQFESFVNMSMTNKDLVLQPNKSAIVPQTKTRNSLKKFVIDESLDSSIYKKGENYNRNNIDINNINNSTNTTDCFCCNRMLKLNLNKKMEEFIEKLTIFTYNN